ncbi:MAG: RnfABCDGE type electron transport complex subunit D [Clostridiales bacterium]|jgi:electron transport complex protein RnfD|nr:RnfABCDGE type electron transport complex subunit D [Clostridiales bacterium]
MDNLTVSSSPHLTERRNTTRLVMLDALIALFPCVFAATLFYGYQVILNLAVCCAACLGAELLYDLIRAKSFGREGVRQSTCWDLSCLVTGVILTLNLPAYAEIWGLNLKDAAGGILLSFDALLAVLVGGAFAVVLVKKLFGGIGRNFANPAVTARIFLMLCFSAGFVVSSTWADFGLFAKSGATWLGTDAGARPGLSGKLFLSMILGNVSTMSVGETSLIAIGLGLLYLTVRKRIDPRYPLMTVGCAFLFSLLFAGIDGADNASALFGDALAQVLSGGLLFMAVFMATDFSTSPNTLVGNAVFSGGLALLTVLIRRYGLYPEGASFALLLMNILAPLIDRYIVPRPFGYVKAKRPAQKKDAPQAPGKPDIPDKTKKREEGKA